MLLLLLTAEATIPITELDVILTGWLAGASGGGRIAGGGVNGRIRQPVGGGIG